MEETLGKRIAANRKRIGMTQDKLAEQLGITAQAVSKWENDQSCPDITTLPRLAELFGISTDVLLGCDRPQIEKVHEAEALPRQTIPDEMESEGFRYQNGKWEFRYDGGRKDGVALAVWVLLTGTLLLATTIWGKDVGLWSILWPSGLLVLGLFELYPKFSFIKLGSALLGGFFLLRNLGVKFFEDTVAMDYIFPVLLLLFGASLLADALQKPRKNQYPAVSDREKTKHRSSFRMDDASFACAIAFGGDRKHIQLPRLSGGKAEVCFGELTVDLTGVEEIAENCRIRAECAFGALRFLVPACWRVETNTDTAFASIDIQGEPTPESQAVIVMDADISFGQIIIQYE